MEKNICNFKTFEEIKKNDENTKSSQDVKDREMLYKVNEHLKGLGFIKNDSEINVKKIVKVIDKNGIDVSDFEFPFGSYKDFKRKVKNGYYNVCNIKTKLTFLKKYRPVHNDDYYFKNSNWHIFY